jgi:DNA invertase Pin-like site-specific DNA recombinase
VICRTLSALCGLGAILNATDQPIDTGTAAGKCFLDMPGVLAAFETNLRRERQHEGIAKAKAADGLQGPAAFDRSGLVDEGARHARPVDIAKALKIGRASVYRVLAADQIAVASSLGA